MTWLLSVIVTFLVALLAMAFYTLFERKLLAHIQWRKGPDKVGLAGLPQPLADALKLFVKQQSIPVQSNYVGFFAAPVVGLGLALTMWVFNPYLFVAVLFPFGTLGVLVLSGLNVYGMLMAGWSSNSKYALLGTMRSVAQSISYEISMALFLLSLLVLLQTFNFVTPLYYHWTWNLLLFPPLGVVWFVTLLAETNRTPFDFAEGESELVSGFNIEYGGSKFALIFMAEYVSILIMSSLTSALFFTALAPSIVAPLVQVMFAALLAGLFIVVRGAMPRMRYDQLMMLTWKTFLPFSLALLMLLIVLVNLLAI